MLAGGRSFISKPAAKALKKAKEELREQHMGNTLEGVYHVEIRIFYQDKRWWLDADNAASFVLDALKDYILKDDSPKEIADLIVRRPILDRESEAHTDITLTQIK